MNTRPSTKLRGGHLFVPDLHGHLPRLQAALNVAKKIPEVKLVFLGDLIDDSPRRRQARKDYRPAGTPDQSRDVLRLVREWHDRGRAQVVLGNHEVMAIKTVLDQDDAMLDIWWRHGGRETASSYGHHVRDTEGPLVDDLQWLKEHGKLWVSVGLPGQQVLAAHATRPHPERVRRNIDRFEHLTPHHAEDPVVWFPLGETPEDGVLRALPEGHLASVHGHMQGREVRTLPGPDGLPAFQLDLGPEQGKMAFLHSGEQGHIILLVKKW